MQPNIVALAADGIGDPVSGLFMAHLLVALASAYALIYLALDLRSLARASKFLTPTSITPARSKASSALWLMGCIRQDQQESSSSSAEGSGPTPCFARAFGLSMAAAALGCFYVLLNIPLSPEAAFREGLLPLIESLSVLACSVAAGRLGLGAWTRSARQLVADPGFALRTRDRSARDFAVSESFSLESSAEPAEPGTRGSRRL